jgi:hypothetical protein
MESIKENDSLPDVCPWIRNCPEFTLTFSSIVRADQIGLQLPFLPVQDFVLHASALLLAAAERRPRFGPANARFGAATVPAKLHFVADRVTCQLAQYQESKSVCLLYFVIVALFCFVLFRLFGIDSANLLLLTWKRDEELRTNSPIKFPGMTLLHFFLSNALGLRTHSSPSKNLHYCSPTSSPRY